MKGRNDEMAVLRDPRDPRFAGLIALYEESIPERERKPTAAIAAMTTSSSHRVTVACDGDVVTGFSLLYLGAALVLLEYLATDARVRGQGLGAMLYLEMRAAAGARPLIVEVESDREDCADRDLRRRRIAFYRRLGCRRISGLDFVLPLEGAGPPPLLDLLVDGIPQSAIAGADLAHWLTEIYTEVYGCGQGDARLRAMIASLPARALLD